MERDGGRDQQQRIKDLFGFFSFLFSPRRRHGHHSTTIADVDGRDVNVSSNNRIKGTLRDGGMRQLATRLDGPTDRPTATSMGLVMAESSFNSSSSSSSTFLMLFCSSLGRRGRLSNESSSATSCDAIYSTNQCNINLLTCIIITINAVLTKQQRCDDTSLENNSRRQPAVDGILKRARPQLR